VTIIIPTRDGIHLERCIESIRRLSTYEKYDVTVVDNQSTLWATKAYLSSLAESGSARVLEYDSHFNHSAICNLAVRETAGDVLCLLNDDVEVLTPDWLEEMVSHALRPEIGAVGAKLLYPDGRVQHAGVVLGLDGLAGHAHRLLMSNREGYMGRAALVQNYSAVTGACLVIRRSVYEQVGGFDAQRLPHIYNDVDFCLRVREAGYWNVWTPYAELVHFESVTRRAVNNERAAGSRLREQIEYMRSRWGPWLHDDPGYNPNLSLTSNDFSLAWPPRTERPWTRRTPDREGRNRRWIAAARS
jgi:GT2 family glycosyltransferase